MEDRPNCKEKKIELASWGKLQSSVLVSETEQLQWWSCGLSFRPLDTAHCRNGQWHFLLPGISLSFSSSTCYHHSILSSWLTFFKKSVCLNILIKCISVCLIPMEARKGHWIPWNWSTEADLPCGCWELNRALLEEQPMFLITSRFCPAWCLTFYVSSVSLWTLQGQCTVF